MAPEARTPAGIRLIDLRMAGAPQTNAAYLVEAEEPALIETGPRTCFDTLARALGNHGVGPQDLAHVVVSHIHLDHAGGVGDVARAFPRATIWVQERGAPHLVDPGRLIASTTRVFGEEHMRTVLGTIEPVPADRIRALAGVERISLGNRTLEVVHAPGHASHHVFVIDSETGALFTGDAFGLLLPGVRILRPSTPPPEFDLERAIRSIRFAQERMPPVLLFSHFGPADEVEHLCNLAIRRMRKWAELVEAAMRDTDDPQEVTRRLTEGIRGELAPAGDRREELEKRYDLLNGVEMNAVGLMRYLRKREESRPEGP